MTQLMIIQYDSDDFKQDHPDLTDAQLDAVLNRLEAEMDYSMIDEYIRGELSDLAVAMFPDIYEQTQDEE